MSQIQQNKQMLESKIKEYETQLLKMSCEPETQEILAKFNKNGSAKRGSSQRSCEENMEQ